MRYTVSGILRNNSREQAICKQAVTHEPTISVVLEQMHCLKVKKYPTWNHWAGAYPRFKKWGTNHGEREERRAKGAEGVGCVEGVSPSLPGEGSYAPSSEIFPFFWAQNGNLASFGAFWELILLHLNCLSYTHKPVSLDFGL